MTKSRADSGGEPRGWRDDPDVEVMLRVKEGDTHAFRELVDRYGTPLVPFAVRFVGSRARAEELVQDAFLQIFRARNRYEPRARFLTYLYRVLTNLCLNEVRRAEYHGRVESLDGNADDGGLDGHRVLADEQQPTQDERMMGRETAGRIEEVLEKLPDNQKSALLLSRVEGFSYEEVGEVLETSVSAVKSLIFRATRTLREELEDVLPKS